MILKKNCPEPECSSEQLLLFFLLLRQRPYYMPLINNSKKICISICILKYKMFNILILNDLNLIFARVHENVKFIIESTV